MVSFLKMHQLNTLPLITYNRRIRDMVGFLNIHPSIHSTHLSTFASSHRRIRDMVDFLKTHPFNTIPLVTPDRKALLDALAQQQQQQAARQEQQLQGLVRVAALSFFS